MATLSIFDHIRATTPNQTIEFDSIKEAREAMHKLDCYTQPAEVSTDRFICRNYPNVYAIMCREEKTLALDLYAARDPKWLSEYNPAY